MTVISSNFSLSSQTITVRIESVSKWSKACVGAHNLRTKSWSDLFVSSAIGLQCNTTLQWRWSKRCRCREKALCWQVPQTRTLSMKEMHTKHMKQGVALTGRNSTGPSCSVGRPTAHAPGLVAAHRPRDLPPRYRPWKTTTDASQQNNTGLLGGAVIITA